MRARSMLVLLALAMLVGIAWIAGRIGRVPSNAPADLAAATGSEIVASEPLDPLESPVRIGTAERIDVVANSATVNESASVAGATDEELLPQVELRVLEHGTRTPVEGAQILIFHERQLSFPALIRRGPIDAANAARVLVTDVEGRAWAPIPNNGAIAFARKEERTGYAVVTTQSGASVPIPITADGALEVVVVDLDGAPLAGIPVTLLRRFSGFRHDYGEVLSDSRGVARLPHARMLTTRWSGSAKWFAAVRGVFEVPIQRPITEEHLDGEVLQLTVPPFGRCDVEVRNARGELETAPFEICLDVDRGDKEHNSTSFAPRDDAIWSERTTGGTASFPVVQLGTTLRATVQHVGNDVKLVVRDRGPVEPNSRVLLTARTADTTCVITGRAMLPSSIRTSTARLRASIHSSTNRHYGFFDVEVALDQNLRFRALFAPLGETSAREFVLCTANESRSNGLIARVALPDELRTGEYDVGEMHFVDAPVLAAGVVLDALSQGLADVSVSVVTPHGDGRLEWDNATTFAERRSDASGRFEIRASDFPQRFRVRARRGNTWVESETLMGATEQVVLQLASSGSIAAVVLLDESIDVRALQLVAQRTDSGERAGYNARRSSDSIPATFVFDHVPVGEYSIVAKAHAETTCARVEGVLVESDEVTHDRRLHPLDLRGELRSIEVTIASAANRPLAGIWAVSRTTWPDQRVEIARRSWMTTTATFVCGRDGLDLRVGAPGHAEVELLGVHANVEIRLLAAPLVVLTLPNDVIAELAEGQYLAVALARESFDTDDGEFAPPRAFDRQVVELLAPASGRLRVRLTLNTTNEFGQTLSRSVSVDPPQFIDVPSSGSSAPIEVRVSVEDLRRALSAKKGSR